MLTNITLAELGGFIAVLVPVVGCIFFLYKLYGRFEKLERQASYRQEDTAMIFKGLRGCLEGLQQVGANGAVSETLHELNSYTDNKAAGLTGDGKCRG